MFVVVTSDSQHPYRAHLFWDMELREWLLSNCILTFKKKNYYHSSHLHLDKMSAHVHLASTAYLQCFTVASTPSERSLKHKLILGCLCANRL